MSTATWHHGDVRDILPTLPDASHDLVACSPPFWRQRGYLPADHPDKWREIGQEPHPCDFLNVLLDLTAQWRRLLTRTGTIAVELGDTMSGSGGAGGDYDEGGFRAGQPRWNGSASATDAVLPKSHSMIPEAYRFALVWGINPFTGAPSPAGRWIVRNVVDWCRRNPTPGDDGDKFRRATSDIVIATLAGDRWWDGFAVRVPLADSPGNRYTRKVSAKDDLRRPDGSQEISTDNRITKDYAPSPDGKRPLYDWWDLSSDPYPGAHYAVWPPEIARRLILSMCPAKVCLTCGEPQRRITATTNALGKRPAGATSGKKAAGGLDVLTHADMNGGPDAANIEHVGWSDCGHDSWRPGRVLDPFAGSGTTGSVATGNGRDATLVDLDQRNLGLAYDRIGGLFLQEAEPVPPGIQSGDDPDS